MSKITPRRRVAGTGLATVMIAFVTLEPQKVKADQFIRG